MLPDEPDTGCTRLSRAVAWHGENCVVELRGRGADVQGYFSYTSLREPTQPK
jgi:hypothetical protein